GILGGQKAGQLDAPFLLQLGHAQQGRAHQRNNDACDQAKDPFPDLLYVAPAINPDPIEGANEPATDDKTDEQTQSGSHPYLQHSKVSGSNVSGPLEGHGAPVSSLSGRG